MSRKITRRKFMATTAAGAAVAAVKFPTPAIAQAAPFKLGLLTVKTGPLAQGGIQMEQGVITYLKEKNYTMAGRKVEFFSADTGGSPAGTKTKVQELVERDKVDVILGPLAAFELLAITDYIAQVKTNPPTFVMFSNKLSKLHFSFERFVENRIRQKFPFAGTPIIIRQRLRRGGTSRGGARKQ